MAAFGVLALDDQPGVAPVPERPTVTLSARFLGSFDLAIDGRRVPLGSSRRTRALLAYLVDRRAQPVPKEALMDVFWPDADPDSARNNMHVALCAARKALARAWSGTVIERRGDIYQLSSDLTVWTDVDEFGRRVALAAAAAARGDVQGAITECETALSLYGGDFLADDPYLDWAIERREQQRLLAVGCADQLSELHLRRGDLHRAVVTSTQVLREEPCHEQVARRLMVAYARLGQPHLALRQYERIVDVLDREIGVAPASETLELADLIRRRAPV
jgi:DNA-binding SARP family transcriptional activator